MNKTEFLLRYGPWALVTGASDGIGHAFAVQLADMGFNLVIVSRQADRLQRLAEEMKERHGIDIKVVVADLSTRDGLAEVDRATAKVDIGLLVAAAGYGTSGFILNADLEREHNMLEVNCFASLHQCVVFGNRFAARGRGGIILLSSLLAWQGVPRSAHYAATKAYVQSLAEALRVELKSKRIEVLASAPGPVNSGFARRADMRMGAAMLPVAVAKESIEALGRKGTVVPGALSKLLTYSLLPLPRILRTQILARVMRGMTEHQTSARAPVMSTSR